MENKGGRPEVYTEEEIERINQEMEEYIASETPLPSISDFALQYNHRRATIYDHEGFSYNREKILIKRELALEKLGFAKKGSASMAIFCLKNLGWSDRREIDLKGSLKHNYENKTDEELDEELAALEQETED